MMVCGRLTLESIGQSALGRCFLVGEQKPWRQGLSLGTLRYYSTVWTLYTYPDYNKSDFSY